MILDTPVTPSGALKGHRTCDKCKTNPTDRFWCFSCSYEYLNETYPPKSPMRRLEAKKSGLPDFPDVCETHGLTLFSTRTGLCRPCHHARAVARRDGQRQYDDVCETHGLTLFSVNTGRCLTCFTGNGATRAPGRTTLRSAARRAGLTVYHGTCDAHGATLFGVNTGKCLVCFTAMGVPRKTATPDLRDAARAVLEAAGFTPEEVTRLVR